MMITPKSEVGWNLTELICTVAALGIALGVSVNLAQRLGRVWGVAVAPIVFLVGLAASILRHHILFALGTCPLQETATDTRWPEFEQRGLTIRWRLLIKDKV